jgi:hypothetical protein
MFTLSLSHPFRNLYMLTDFKHRQWLFMCGIQFCTVRKRFVSYSLLFVKPVV